MNALRSTLLLCWLALASPLLAADAITNVMSPVVSYQYFNDLGSEALTNGGVMSPVASYQYFDSLGTNVTYQQSAQVSYFFNVPSSGNAFTLTGRVLDSAGVPVTGATVSAAVLETTQFSATTAADGSYQIPALPQGVYVLSAAKAGYARDRRVVSFGASSARQDFRLVPTAAPPVLNDASGTAPPFQPPQSTDINGSALLVFDGTQFVPDTTPTRLDRSKMTVVMTHGWIFTLPLIFPPGADDGSTGWPTDIATALRAKGLTSGKANIVAWDWNKDAKGVGPPEDHTPRQGLALGKELYGKLGSGYQTNIHFMGHSLGALVNRYAVNYLHGQANAKQEVADPHWDSARTQVTVFDGAELAYAASFVKFAGAVAPTIVGVDSALANLVSEGREAFAWKTSVPLSFAWMDNYRTDFGLEATAAVNVLLQKAMAPFHPVNAHSAGMNWYEDSITRVTDSSVQGFRPLLGFRQSQEYNILFGAGIGSFPPAGDGLRPPIKYHQKPSASDPLELEQVTLGSALESVWVPIAGEVVQFVVVDAPDYVVDKAATFGRKVGDTAIDVVDATAVSVYRGVNAVVDETVTVGRQVIDLLSRATIRITLRTGQPPSISIMSRQTADNTTPTNAPAYAWLPLAVPADAALMNFEFTVTGDGKDDSVVFGINGTNLFSLETKFLSDGEATASRLIDVTSYAGTTNEFFFGLLGGSSTNCTVQIQNIKFFTLAPPQLFIAKTNGTAAVSWASTLTGFSLETSASLTPPSWQPVTNSPTLYGGTMTVTNIPSERANFFRLRKL